MKKLADAVILIYGVVTAILFFINPFKSNAIMTKFIHEFYPLILFFSAILIGFIWVLFRYLEFRLETLLKATNANVENSLKNVENTTKENNRNLKSFVRFIENHSILSGMQKEDVLRLRKMNIITNDDVNSFLNPASKLM